MKAIYAIEGIVDTGSISGLHDEDGEHVCCVE